MSDDLTEARLAELEALLAEATPGPWQVESDERPRSNVQRCIEADGGNLVVAAARDYDVRTESIIPMRNNARLIVEARNALPALIAEIRKLRAQVVSHCERIAAASEVIGRNAERSPLARLQLWLDRNPLYRRPTIELTIYNGWHVRLTQYGGYEPMPMCQAYGHSYQPERYTVCVGTDAKPATLGACILAALELWDELQGKE